MTKERIMNNLHFKYLIGASIVLFVAGAAGCGTVQQPVRVFAGHAELQQLAGEWAGEYTSTTNDRNGLISFTLKAGTDSAFGSIVMLAPEAEMNNPSRSYHYEGPVVSWKVVQTLVISFVVMDGNRVRGTLEPYFDSNYQCTVTTLFEGFLRGDEISGIYSSTGSSLGLMTSGTWRVTRQGSASGIVHRIYQFSH
ncbi:MAG TPA: hypothetical protein VIL52_07160 [Bacteroidota bacterium]